LEGDVSCVGFVFCVDLAGASVLKLSCSLRAKEDRMQDEKSPQDVNCPQDEQQNPQNEKSPQDSLLDNGILRTIF
jgi:hypothetical protein